ncbi:MAG TPA: hypothetical protein VLX29_07760, partial [Nitrospirota bacterium]|nr:hypothetical protein [Nitrospirota bacterium]
MSKYCLTLYSMLVSAGQTSHVSDLMAPSAFNDGTSRRRFRRELFDRFSTDDRVLPFSELACGSKILAGSGVFLSVDNGASWTPVNTGLSNYTINALAVSSDTLGYVFVGTDEGIRRRPLSEITTS